MDWKRLMWTGVGPGRWSRDEGYLLSDGDLMLELHGDTMHVYRKDPKADPKAGVGSPLDGYMWQSTEPRCQVNPGTTVVDAPSAWRLLGERAALIDTTRTPDRGRVPRATA